MSRFMVVYSKVAEDQLAQAWLDAGPERNAVTTAANAMETMLASDPLPKPREPMPAPRLDNTTTISACVVAPWSASTSS